MPVINLQKYGSDMQSALKSVRDPKNPMDWALFGYDGKTFDLKVVSTGEDGLEELVDDLNPSKIMYGFIKIKDPKSTLSKYIFLHWQGEGCPATLKGQASNLLRDVQKYIGSFQITITARNEDEADIDEIMKQVEKGSTSQFNFKTRKQIPKDAIPRTAVSSVHRKIVPSKALPTMEERDKFWSSEQASAMAKKQTQKVVVTKNDLPSKEEREGVWKARDAESMKNQGATQKVVKANTTFQAKQQNISDNSKSLQERKEMLEKSTFATNTQIEENKVTKPKTDPIPSIPTSSKPSPHVVSNSFSEEDEPAIEDKGQVDYLEYDEQEVDDNIYQNEPDILDDNIYQNEPDVGAIDADDMYENFFPEDIIVPEEKQDLGICAITLYDYEAEDDGEISFEPGEVITNIEKPDDNWWQGISQDGTLGLFPSNYVEEIDQSELEVS